MYPSNTARTSTIQRFIAIAAAIALAVALTPVGSADAVTSADKYAEADAVMAQINTLQDNLNAAQAEYDQALADHDTAQAAADEAQKRKDAADKRTAELQTKLSGRAESMYKTGGTVSFLEVCLGSSSFDEFLTNWDAMQSIAENDASMIQESKDLRQEAADAETEFRTQTDLAKTKMDEADASKKSIEATQASLRDQVAQINAEAQELAAQEEAAAQAAEAARQAAEAAANNTSNGSYNYSGSSAGASVVSGSGIFTHPCPTATVSSTFGYRSFDSSFHKGVDLAAPEGTPYYAADAGTVIIAGWSSSAGNWIVISHGNGIVTKYMHSSAIYVTAGQQVERGQNIGAVGNTGNSFGAHLHFQVEINATGWQGTAVDPMAYI